MSSAIRCKLNSPLPIRYWTEFCTKYDIQYSPNTVGQNVFYKNEVQVVFGSEGSIKKENGVPDFSTAKPPEEASEIVLSTYFLGNLKDVVDLFILLVGQFPCKVEYDTEFSYLLGNKT